MTAKLVDANTRFGFKLFTNLTAKQPNANVFVSPSSVAFALSMAYNGANGATQQAMADALQVQGMSLADLNRANADLRQQLENPDPQVQLAIANSLWSRQGVSFKSSFMQRNRQFYRAKVSELDFRSPQAVSTINAWVSQNTQGKIDTIVEQISPDDVMFLINAIYFKGDWSRPFDPQQTTQAEFYLANGSRKQHPMMAQQGEYRYTETEQYQAVRLPYGSGQRMSMIILLPKPSVKLSTWLASLDGEMWQGILSQLRNRPGAVQIPRFKLEYEIELSRTLTEMGMGEAFSSRADFSGLSSVPTQIDAVQHKTFVEVNEKGTEAAAVTSIGIRATSAIMPQEPFRMVVNRPFFCAIHDGQTGSILFMGAIANPQS
jgi:serine protease inhibitor